jgi:hypothetical protein
MCGSGPLMKSISNVAAHRRARRPGIHPEEIALAIVAEIQHVFAGGSIEPLRERKRSIHGTLECANMSAL